MRPLRTPLAWLALLAAAAAVRLAAAATVVVPAGADLAAAVATAAPGDVLQLAAGDYVGNVVIDRPLTLQGPADHAARVVGSRKGRTLWVKAADVTLRGLTVTRSGLSLPDMDAGIFLDKTATRAQVLSNRMEDNLVGVYIWGAHDALVRGNVIRGNTTLRENERGNGVTLWNAPGTQVIGNDVSGGRDGIFSNSSRNNLFRGNRFTHVRYAVHYMYTDASEISDNVSIGNEIAYALMFSRHLTVRGNIGMDSSDQGMNLNATQNSTIENNEIRGGGRCAFFYNSNFNRVAGNVFSGCDVGIHYTAGSEGNAITGNAFIANKTQVKYVGTRVLDWSEKGQGNYWSDNSAFDLNGDGIADTAYRPNDIIDQVVWRAPAARLLLTSPAVTIVRWAQKQFPALLPGGILDSAPLMKAPQLVDPNREGRS